MPWCLANGCHNQTDNIRTNKSVSYHSLPKDSTRYKAWAAAIGREKIPASGKICSEHFTLDCFEISTALKLSVATDVYKGRNVIRPRLKPDAVPTLFSHKQSINIRTSSLNREIKRNHAEVSVDAK